MSVAVVGSQLYQTEQLLKTLGVPFVRDRKEEHNIDCIVIENGWDNVAKDSKIDGYIGFYVSIEFDLQGNFIKFGIWE